MNTEHNNIQKIFITVFILILILPTFIWGILKIAGKFEPSVMSRTTGDFNENRNLAEFPANVSAQDFPGQFEKYYNDHLPFRSLIITANKKITNIMEDTYDDYIQPAIIDAFYSDSEVPFFPPRLQNNNVLIGRDGWYFYALDNSIDYYRATNILEDDTMKDYLSTMNKLQDICDSKGKTLQYVIFPNKEQVYSEYMPTYAIVDEYKREPRFVDYVRNNSRINIIYPLDDMKSNKSFGQLYLKYDTHWNNAGAFVGSQALLKALGMETTSINDVKTEIGDIPMEGDMINLGALDKDLLSNEINYKVYYKPDIQVENGGTADNTYASNIYKSTSSSTNKKKLVMICDSYRIALTPYMEKEFAEMTTIYRNNILDNEAVEAIKNADVIIFEAVERYDEAIISDSENVIDILSK